MNVLKDKMVRFLLIVFIVLVFYSIPLLIFKDMQKKIINLEIKEDLNQLSIWAQLYNNKYRTYQGIENNEEVKKLVDRLNSLQADCQLVISERGDRFALKPKCLTKR